MSQASRSTFREWNDALVKRFFTPEMAGRPVYLFITDDVINEVGHELDADLDAFLAAVRDGPPGTSRAGHCQRALEIANRWRERGFVAPPYVSYLALFVLAGGHDGNFAPNAYYPRLWELLGEPGSGMPRSFERIDGLWADLEDWSVHDMHGELGLFEARVVGGMNHIGLPLAQTVLTEAERRALPTIFADAGLEPGRPPSTRELNRALVVCGRPWLRARTLSALNSGSASFVEAVLDLAADDFQEWSGEVVPSSGQDGRTAEIAAGLRLCLALDRVAGRARVSMRCRARREFPDRGLLLTPSGSQARLSCTEFAGGWSSPLVDAETGAQFKPELSQWSSGLQMSDVDSGWRVRHRPARLRAFVEGSIEALPGLVEVPDLPTDRPFFLAFPSTSWPRLQRWLEDDCTGWRPLEIVSGLPGGWIFGEVAVAANDLGARAVEPGLGFTDRLSLRFIGGIHSSAGNSYLAVAPPTLRIDGATTGDVVYLDDAPLCAATPSPSTYQLPDDAPTDRRIVIDVRRGGSVFRRSSVYLVSGFPWRLDQASVKIDRHGEPVNGVGVAGSIVPWPAPQAFKQDVFRTPGLNLHSSRIYWAGATVGQVASWPREPLPNWTPIWAITAGSGGGRVVYCGTSLLDAEPVKGHGYSTAKRRHWRSLLWRHRRHMPHPQEGAIKKLWRRYQEVARAIQ